MSELTAVDILIEPDEATIQRAKQLNLRMLQSEPDGITLDTTHQPHITMLQRYMCQPIGPRARRVLSGPVRG
jgi:hypothetical protein